MSTWLPRAVLSAVAPLAIAIPAFGQTTRTLSGTVRDSAGGPIPDALVAVVDTNETAYHARTNARGRFTLEYRAVDTARLYVSHVRYLRFWRRLDSLTTDRNDSEIDIRLATSSEWQWALPRRPLDIHDDTIPDAELEDVARAAGLPLLRERERGGGDREIRLAIGGGLFVPEDLLVLHSRAGRITGEVWYWWGPVSSRRRPDELKRWPKHVADYGCDGARPLRAAQYSDGNEEFVMFVCRARFSREPDWAALWRRLDSLGVWTLPNEDQLPRFGMTLDGFVLTIEMFDGTNYRLIRHGNPDPASSPEAARAAQIARLVGAVTNGRLVKKQP
jgi:hypothetical protein